MSSQPRTRTPDAGLDVSDQTRQIFRTLHPEVRIVSERDGTVDYVASDESIDSYKERILAKGWRFDRFKKNAPFVDSHNYDCIDRLLGRVLSFTVTGQQLVERVQWAIDVERQPLAKLGFDLTVKGYLKAVSVGFFPTKLAWPGSQDWPDAVKEAGLTAEEAADTRAIYREQQQYELSACIIGANPNALAKAFRSGDTTEATLHACGIRDDDLGFLLQVGDAWEQADPMLRVWAIREIEQRATSARKQTLSEESTRSGPDVDPSRQDRTQTEAAQVKREAFLRRLQAITRN